MMKVVSNKISNESKHTVVPLVDIEPPKNVLRLLFEYKNFL